MPTRQRSIKLLNKVHKPDNKAVAASADPELADRAESIFLRVHPVAAVVVAALLRLAKKIVIAFGE